MDTQQPALRLGHDVSANTWHGTNRWQAWKRRIGLAAALQVVLAGVLVAAPAKPAPALENGLAVTPPMGFNDWNAFGCNVDADLIEQTALAMHTNGMQAAGYEYVNIDDCWMTRSRDAEGHLVPDPVKFPEGIKGVADYVHSLGLKLGIYEDSGTHTCAGYPGSYGHEKTDAQDFADWGVDYLKYDNCNLVPGTGDDQQDYIDRYTRMRDALAATGRPIVYSLCEWGRQDVWTWGADVGNLWRTTGDIGPSFNSMLSIFRRNVGLAQYAGPGHWNDPDMLEVGNGGMTLAENRAEFSLWAEMAAPLIAGTDLRTGTPPTRVPGRLGSAVSLNGSGQYVSLPSGVVSGLHDFTISAWVYPRSTSTWSRVFDFGTGTRVNMFLTVDNGRGPRFAITNRGSGAEQRLTGDAPLPTDQWTLLTVTHSGDTGTLYVDGTPVAMNTAMTLSPADLGVTDANYIGKSQYADPYLNADVDDFQVYDHALSATEVQALAGGQAGDGNVASYRFDEQSGTTAVDSSGNGRDGSLVAAGLKPEIRDVYTNPEVIAVDQDPLGRQGTVVSSDDTHWTLAKPLSGGDQSVVFFNASTSPAPMSAAFADLGLPAGPPYIVRDLWRHEYSAAQGTLGVEVPGHAVAMYRVTPDRFDSLPAVVDDYSTDPDVAQGLDDKLAAAAAAPSAAVRNLILDAFDHQVAAQTGKAFTGAQAGTLVQLADALR